MQPIDILMTEHRVIEQVLSCLEKMSEQALREEKLDCAAAKDAVGFFRFFADRCHHAKEEAHLFPLLEAKGFSQENGPTGVMLYEHEQGRHHIRSMGEAIEPASLGDPAACDRFVQHAQAYVELLRAHINKEDHCLFAMANKVMTDADRASLLESFVTVEHEEGEGSHEKYLQMADDLADRYGVPKVRRDTEYEHGDLCCRQHAKV